MDLRRDILEECVFRNTFSQPIINTSPSYATLGSNLDRFGCHTTFCILINTKAKAVVQLISISILKYIIHPVPSSVLSSLALSILYIRLLNATPSSLRPNSVWSSSSWCERISTSPTGIISFRHTSWLLAFSFLQWSSGGPGRTRFGAFLSRYKFGFTKAREPDTPAEQQRPSCRVEDLRNQHKVR